MGLFLYCTKHGHNLRFYCNVVLIVIASVARRSRATIPSFAPGLLRPPAFAKAMAWLLAMTETGNQEPQFMTDFRIDALCLDGKFMGNSSFFLVFLKKSL
jgi:hypothetical protein